MLLRLPLPCWKLNIQCRLLSQECCDLSSVTRRQDVKQSEWVQLKDESVFGTNTCFSLFWAHWRRMLPTLICIFLLLYLSKTLSFFSYCSASSRLPWSPQFPCSVLSLSCITAPHHHQFTPTNLQENRERKVSIFSSTPSYPLPLEHCFLQKVWDPNPTWVTARCRTSGVPPKQAQQTPGWGRDKRQADLYQCDGAHMLQILFGFRIKSFLGNHVKVH